MDWTGLCRRLVFSIGRGRRDIVYIHTYLLRVYGTVTVLDEDEGDIEGEPIGRKTIRKMGPNISMFEQQADKTKHDKINIPDSYSTYYSSVVRIVRYRQWYLVCTVCSRYEVGSW